MMMSRQRRFALGWSTLTVKAVVENTLLVVVTRGGSTMSSSSSSAHTHKDADFDGVDDFTVGAFGKQQQQHRLRQDHPTLTTLREGRRRRRWKKETERRGFAATPKTKEEGEPEEEEGLFVGRAAEFRGGGGPLDRELGFRIRDCCRCAFQNACYSS